MNAYPSDPPAPPPPVALSADQNLVIPVMSEEAKVHMELEHTGTVRVRKVIHQASEPVHAGGYREVVETTRVPVNQVTQAVKPPWQQGAVLVIPIYEERLVKQLVLLEELHVTCRREPFQDSENIFLRREEVIVERLDPQTRQWVPQAS